MQIKIINNIVIYMTEMIYCLYTQPTQINAYNELPTLFKADIFM